MGIALLLSCVDTGDLDRGIYEDTPRVELIYRDCPLYIAEGAFDALRS